MQTLSYKEQTDRHNIEKIRELQKKLPRFTAEYFRALEIRKSTNTRKNYAYDLGTFFFFLQERNSHFKNKEVADITLEDIKQIQPVDIEEYLSFLEYYERDGVLYRNREEGKARKLSSLNNFYNYYLKKELISYNPVALVDVPKIKEKNIIRLEPNEVVELLDIVESGEKLTKKQMESHEKTKIRDAALITLLLGTGIRVSECVGLDLDDVDFDNGAIRVIRKGGNEDLVYFGEEVENALLAYYEVRKNLLPAAGHEQALFISLKDTRLSARSVERLVKKYASLVTTVKKITPHKLRSTFGTTLYEETQDIYLVADTLGHKNVDTTRKHYAAMNDNRKRQASRAVRLRETLEKPGDSRRE